MVEAEMVGEMSRKKQGIFSSWQKFTYAKKGPYLLEYKLGSRVDVTSPLQLYEVKGCFVQDSSMITGKPTSFIVYLRDGKSLHFSALNVVAKQQWMEALKDVPEDAQPKYGRVGSQPNLHSSRSSNSLLSERTSLNTPSYDPPKYQESEKKSLGSSESAHSAHQEVLPIIQFLESFTDAVIIGDINGMIVATNTAADRMFGWAPGTMAGKPLTVLMPEPYKSHHDAYLFRHEKFGQTNLIGKIRNLQGVRQNGDHFDVQISLGKVPNSQSFIATMREVDLKNP